MRYEALSLPLKLAFFCLVRNLPTKDVQPYNMKLLNLITCLLLITGSAFSQSTSEITDFNAERMNGSVNITWTPSNDAATNHFEIQKSVDGVNWKVVAIMFPFEDLSQAHTYSYSDKVQSKDGSYYRIRQIETSKKENYSEVKMIDVTTASK